MVLMPNDPEDHTIMTARAYMIVFGSNPMRRCVGVRVPSRIAMYPGVLTSRVAAKISVPDNAGNGQPKPREMLVSPGIGRHTHSGKVPVPISCDQLGSLGETWY